MGNVSDMTSLALMKNDLISVALLCLSAGKRTILAWLMKAKKKFTIERAKDNCPNVSIPQVASMAKRTMPSIRELAMLAIISLNPTWMEDNDSAIALLGESSPDLIKSLHCQEQ